MVYVATCIVNSTCMCLLYWHRHGNSPYIGKRQEQRHLYNIRRGADGVSHQQTYKKEPDPESPEHLRCYDDATFTLLV